MFYIMWGPFKIVQEQLNTAVISVTPFMEMFDTCETVQFVLWGSTLASHACFNKTDWQQKFGE